MTIKPHANGHANGVDDGGSGGLSQDSAPLAGEVAGDRGPTSTKHLTDRARKAVIHGEEEAWQRGVRNVRTEHLLLGMIRERDNVAAVILRRLRIDLDLIKVSLENAMIADSYIDFPDAAAAACVDLAGDEAQGLGNNYIGTEHLLLGLIREETGLGGRVLRDAGVDLDMARREVSLLQHGERGPAIMKEPATNVPYHTEVEAATRLASLLGHAHVTSSHLAVVLLSDPSETASRILGQFGIDPASLLAQFPEADATTPAGHPTHPSMTYAAGHVLVRACEKAWSMFRQETPCREHLLLALIEESDAAGAILRASGLEPYAALLELMRLREKGL